MPITVSHQLSATTPDDPAYEIKPSNWNASHLFTLNAVGSEISNAFGDGGGVTFGLSADGKITASAPAGGGGLTNINVSAGTTSNNLSAFQFNNANGITFGLDASTITASYTQSTHSHATAAYSAANGSFTANTLSFSNANGVSFVTSAGSAIAASVNTSYRASNDAVGLNTAFTAGPLAWTVNSSGISLNGSSAAGTTSGFGGNLISGSMTHNTAGLNLSLNHPAWLTTARGSTDAIGLNTAQSNVTWTVNSSGLSLDARGYAGTTTGFTGTNVSATMTLNSAGLALQLSGQGGGVINQTGPNIAAGGVTVTDGTVVFSNSNGVSFGIAGSTLTASVNAGGAFSAGMSNVGNTAGTTGLVGSQIVFAGAGEIAVSQSVNGNSATISIYEPPTYLSFFENVPVIHGTQTFNAASSTIYVYPFLLPKDISAAIIRLPMSLSNAPTTGGVPNANSTITGNQGWTHGVMFYTQGGGASSNSLQSYTSTSGTGSFGTTIGAGANSSQQTVTINGSFNQSGVVTDFGTGTSYGVSSGSYVVNSSAMSNFTGPRYVDIPFAATMSAGNYWIGIGKSVSTANNSTIFNGVDVRSSNIFISQTNITWGILGSVTNTSNIMRQPGAGYFTTNASLYTTASINAVGQMSVTTSNLVPYFQLLRKA